MHPHEYKLMVQASGKSGSRSSGQHEHGPAASPASPPDARAPPAANFANCEDEWMRPPQAAAYLKSSTSTLAKHRLWGDGVPYTKLGRNVLYSKRDCDIYLASRRRSSTSEEVET